MTRRRRSNARGEARGRCSRPGTWAAAVAMAIVLSLPAVADDAAERARRDASAAPYTQRLLLELGARRRELDRREDAVDHRERAVAELEGELAGRLREWDELRVALEVRIDELKEGMGDRVARLAKTYGVMDPQQAAVLIATLDRDLATAVIASMKNKQAAKVLAQLPTRRASELSKRLVKPLVLGDVEGEKP